jgi:predicted MFS family arabinose efflux permease
MGIGSILGSLLPRRKAPSIRRTATALGLLGVFIVIFALAPSIWISAGAAFAAGMAGLVAGSAAQAKLRELAGPGHALQVMGLWTVAWAGSKPIASIIDGALPAVTSVRTTGVLMALPALVPIAVLMAWPSRGETDVRTSPPSARLATRATN